jgi:ribosomal protein S12 methylthiotransferase
MRRPAAAEQTLARIARWREICPEITLRSTFIVGFPGETDAEFEDLLEFLTAAELDRVGCFPYSPVAGAAANALPDPVPEEVKLERQARFMAHQAAISARRLAAKVGRTMEILVDGVEEGRLVGRTRGDAPEIDGRVYLSGGFGLAAGTRVQARIDRADTHDLHGVVVEGGGDSGRLRVVTL